MSKENRVSDERLAEMLTGLDGVTPGPWKMEGSIYEHMGAGIRAIPDDRGFAQLWKSGVAALDAAHIARCDPDTIRAIVTELQSLRSKPVAGVELKPLIDAITKATDLLNVVILSGTSVIQGPDGPHSSYTPLATQANAVWCDLIAAQTIISALLPKATAPVVSEPVAKPYAFEFGKSNGDGTYCVVIERGDEGYVERFAVKDWPIKPLYTSPQPEAVITDEMVERAARAMDPFAFREDTVATDEWHELEVEGRAQAIGRARAAITAALKDGN